MLGNFYQKANSQACVAKIINGNKVKKYRGVIFLGYLQYSSQVPVEGKSSVFFNYHYQPGSNDIIVYGKQITQARTQTPLAHTPAIAVQVVAVRWVGVRPTMTKLMPPFACSAGDEWPVGASFK